MWRGDRYEGWRTLEAVFVEGIAVGYAMEGGRCLRRGALGLGDRAFLGDLGGGHVREMGFQRRQHLAYQADVLLLHLVGCFGRTTCDWLRFCEGVVGDRLGSYTKMSLPKSYF
jgi:hypothetical protein